MVEPKTQEQVTVIGGATVDISGFAADYLTPQASNPGVIEFCTGGVGKNIAENLARLGVKTRLLTAVGNDPFGTQILADCKTAGIDVDPAAIARAGTSSVDLAMHDRHGDMQLSISQMDATEAITIDFIKKNRRAIQESSIVVVDGNLNQQTLEYLLSAFSKPFFFDPAALSKVGRIKNVMAKCHSIKPNRLEAEALWGSRIETQAHAQQAAQFLIESGINEVFITMASAGVFFMNDEAAGHLPAADTPVVNDRGAGDAFMAAVIYGYLKEMKIRERCALGMAAAALTMAHQNTVNPSLSVTLVQEMLETFRK